MKKLLLCIALPLLLWPRCAFAVDIPDALREALPEEAETLLEDSSEAAQHGTVSRIFCVIKEKAGELLSEHIRSVTGKMAGMVAVIFLCSVVETAIPEENEPLTICISLAGVLAVSLLTVGEVESLMRDSVEAIEELKILSEALVPTLAAAVATSGGIASASVHQAATIAFSEAFISLTDSLLIPAIYCYIALCAADAILKNARLAPLCDGLQKGIARFMTAYLLLFTGYLRLSGATATAADAMTMRVTKSVISAALPVVGGIVSDATGSILQSAGILKNTVGIAGMAGVLLICLGPFTTVGVRVLLYKLAAMASGLLGDRYLNGYLSRLGSAFALMLGLTGSCALLLLIAAASCVSVVIS